MLWPLVVPLASTASPRRLPRRPSPSLGKAADEPNAAAEDEEGSSVKKAKPTSKPASKVVEPSSKASVKPESKTNKRASSTRPASRPGSKKPVFKVESTLELEMSAIEVSEQAEESPAEAALKIEASVYGSVAPYTKEQLRAIRPIPMPPGAVAFALTKAYHIPFRPIADPAAAARDRERRRKMFALTKAAFPDLRVPTPFVSVKADEISPFPMPFVRAHLVIKPYDESEDSMSC